MSPQDHLTTYESLIRAESADEIQALKTKLASQKTKTEAVRAKLAVQNGKRRATEAELADVKAAYANMSRQEDERISGL
jgi:septal ring factor EnvC (AmiA/AmiB activator)